MKINLLSPAVAAPTPVPTARLPVFGIYTTGKVLLCAFIPQNGSSKKSRKFVIDMDYGPSFSRMIHLFWVETDFFQLLSLYRERVKLPFICHIRADLLTREIAIRLKEAGCHSVDFGVESGDELLRAEILGKPISDEQLYQAAQYLHEVNIPFRTTNMFGLPGESFSQALKNHRNQSKIAHSISQCIDLSTVSQDNPW